MTFCRWHHPQRLPRAGETADSSRWWNRLEAWLLRTSERLNPIVVKEARQALKSRQFTITFTLVLAAGWLWSILGLAMLGPSAYYSTHGQEMFFGYYIILSFSLLIIVPFGAFRSLAAEREDRKERAGLRMTSMPGTGSQSGMAVGAAPGAGRGIARQGADRGGRLSRWTTTPARARPRRSGPAARRARARPPSAISGEHDRAAPAGGRSAAARRRGRSRRPRRSRSRRASPAAAPRTAVPGTRR